MSTDYLELSHRENQVRGLAQYALDFISGRFPPPADSVWTRLEQFHVDSVGCAVAAIAGELNAPTLLREEALRYIGAGESGAPCFGNAVCVAPERAVAANCAAVRELDANGTNFGYNPRTGQCEGEFGHNDFYPVAIAGAQRGGLGGMATARAMLCLDEIRGRLAEAFSLKTYKIDHVLHGAIASAAVYAACVGASVDQIESAIGLLVAHYVPFRAIRFGHQLSDSKGASAALSAEAAVTCVHRAIRGFVGPADIFRNPQAVFCLNQPPENSQSSPFDLELTRQGEDFAIMGMHFKLGIYEHQSAGAIQALIDVLSDEPALLADIDAIQRVRIAIYEPAFSIIGDPAKRDPRTRQSADHSMVYIIATLLRKALDQRVANWSDLMLTLEDYSTAALHDPVTRQLIERIEFTHGGPDYDERYPDGIPTSLEIDHRDLGTRSSGLVMYPMGHARHDGAGLEELLRLKFDRMVTPGRIAPDGLRRQLSNLLEKSPADVRHLYAFAIATSNSVGAVSGHE